MCCRKIVVFDVRRGNRYFNESRKRKKKCAQCWQKILKNVCIFLLISCKYTHKMSQVNKKPIVLGIKNYVETFMVASCSWQGGSSVGGAFGYLRWEYVRSGYLRRPEIPCRRPENVPFRPWNRTLKLWNVGFRLSGFLRNVAGSLLAGAGPDWGAEEIPHNQRACIPKDFCAFRMWGKENHVIMQYRNLLQYGR